MTQNAADNQTTPDSAGSFEQQAQQDDIGFFAEFWDFLKHNKKWWLLPIVGVLLFVGVLVIAGGTGAAPFIYALF